MRARLVCACAASGHAATVPPSAASNSRRPMVTVIRPSRARCVKGTIPRHERAVFIFKEGRIWVASPPSCCSKQTFGLRLRQRGVAVLFDHLIVATPALRLTDVTEYWIGTAASVRLDAGGLDHFAPFFGLVGDEPAEVAGREREHVATQVGKPCLHLGISKASVDPLVELFDDLGLRSLWRAEAEPAARLIARHELTYGRDVRQQF